VRADTRSSLRRFLAARLTPGGTFGLHLTVGLAAALVAAAVFGHLAADVVAHASITILDDALARWLHAHATPGMTAFMLALTHLHGHLGIGVLSILLAAFFLRARAPDWALATAVAVPGGMLLNVLLKLTFQRVRPSFDEPLLTLMTYSFPSGHTVNATLFYGVLAAYFVCRSGKRPVQAALVLLACLMVALVGMSRLYLGVHYFSDVLAGMAEGLFWLAVCITSVSTLRRHRAANRNRSSS
jgi:membrane-associated phospholipid phosphatase